MNDADFNDLRQAEKKRLEKTSHVSTLRKKLKRLRRHDSEPMGSYEEWLIKAAETRANHASGEEKLRNVTNEELIVTLLLVENTDRPRLFETIAVLRSRLPVDEKQLRYLAERERVDFLLPQITG